MVAVLCLMSSSQVLAIWEFKAVHESDVSMFKTSQSQASARFTMLNTVLESVPNLTLRDSDFHDAS